jgi:hypothetical protein
MADKVERWRTYKWNNQWRIEGETGRNVAFDIASKEDADLIVTLHNAVLDINPNPMAVAKGLGDLIKVGKLISNMPCICSILTNKDPHPCPPCQLRNTLAAITKPD